MVRIQRVLELRKRAKSRLRPPWRNTDARKTVKLADGALVRQEELQHLLRDRRREVSTALRADEYGGDEDFSWVLLEAVAAPAATASNTAIAAVAEE